MTREEVINGLYDIKNWKCNGDEEMYKTIVEAIQALKQPEPCEDAVSRKAAVEEIRRHGVGSFDFEYYTPGQAERFVIKLLQDLPCVTPEPCEDAVSRKEAVGWFEEFKRKSDEMYEAMREELMEAPSVTPKRKTGKWIELTDCANEGVYCSECHKKVFRVDFSNTMKLKNFKYCPNCGAKMSGGEQE